MGSKSPAFKGRASPLTRDLCNIRVYLEVGYAWGCGVPVVLLTQTTDHLKFDVRGQRCLVYSSIRELEESLRAELENLRANGAV